MSIGVYCSGPRVLVGTKVLRLGSAAILSWTDGPKVRGNKQECQNGSVVTDQCDEKTISREDKILKRKPDGG